MTDTEDALLRAIVAMPGEDTPRLVLADYLDEKGGELDIARAEFIRLQVMLARVEGDTPETTAARLRAEELQKRYGQAWGLPGKRIASWCKVRRGFVDEITIDAPQSLRAEICQLLEREPIRRLVVGRPYDSTWSANGMDWLDVPALRKVCHLTLHGSYWSDREIARLLALANFPTPTCLALYSPPLTAAGVAAIANCERLRNLTALRIDFAQQRREELKVWGGGVLDLGAKAIASSQYLVALQKLSLRCGGIGTPGALALADSPNLNGLTALDLTDNPGIGEVGRVALQARFGSAVILSPPRNP